MGLVVEGEQAEDLMSLLTIMGSAIVMVNNDSSSWIIEIKYRRYGPSVIIILCNVTYL